MGKSNLRSNFTPEVVLWLKLAQNPEKLRLCTKPGTENLILYILMPEGQLWPVMRIPNSKLRKK